MLTTGLALLIVSATVGVDHGWERGPDNEWVYAIQLEEVLTRPLADGQAIKVDVEPAARALRQFAIRLGANPAETPAMLPSATVSHGWRPGEKGGIDYLIQLSPERLESLASGQPVVGTFDSSVQDIRSIYVFMGALELPRDSGKAGTEPPGRLPLASPVREDRPHPPAITNGPYPLAVEPSSPARRRIVADYSARELSILKMLDAETDLESTETPLRQVLDAISSKHSIPIVLDARALQAAEIPSDASVTVSLKGIPLDSALKLTLGELGLAYLIKADVLYVTTEEIAECLVQVRVYDVSPLLEFAAADDLLAAVTTISPTSHAPALFGKHLVVRQSYGDQQETWRVLRAFAGKLPQATPEKD